MIAWVEIGWIIIGLGVASAIFVLWSSAIGAGFEPTSQKKVRWMLELAAVNSNDVVYDLGSGDGRIVIESARRFGSRAVGIEADPTRVLWSRLMAKLFRVDGKVRIIWGNFFNQPLQEASVVTLFLTENTNSQLKTKLEAELKPGTRIVTYVWKIEGWEPKAMNSKRELYLYVT